MSAPSVRLRGEDRTFTSRADIQRSNLPERISAIFLLVLALPLISALAVMVLLVSRRAPFVTHGRVGYRGNPLRMLKLRTMWGGPELSSRKFSLVEHLPERPVPLYKLKTDPRITSRFAAWCRKYSLDELPQLAHVVAGTMSLVGPRPLTPVELDEHYGALAAEVLSVRPGMTGPWQVLGRNRLTYAQRRRLRSVLREAGIASPLCRNFVANSGVRHHRASRVLSPHSRPVTAGRKIFMLADHSLADAARFILASGL